MTTSIFFYPLLLCIGFNNNWNKKSWKYCSKQVSFVELYGKLIIYDLFYCCACGLFHIYHHEQHNVMYTNYIPRRHPILSTVNLLEMAFLSTVLVDKLKFLKKILRGLRPVLAINETRATSVKNPQRSSFVLVFTGPCNTRDTDEQKVHARLFWKQTSVKVLARLNESHRRASTFLQILHIIYYNKKNKT